MKKIHHLHLFLSTFKPDVVVITETWLKSNVTDSELTANLPYNVYRHDRKGRRGGGICCIVSSFIICKEVNVRIELMPDVICVEFLNGLFPSSLRLVAVYRPPNISPGDDASFIEFLSDICSSSSHTLLIGDFNLSIDWPSKMPRNHSSGLYLQFFDNYGFVQYVTHPTLGSNILDLVLCSAPLVTDVSILPPFSNADHNVVTFKVIQTIPSHLPIPVPDFVNLDYRKLDAFLHCIDWWAVFDNYTSIDDVYKRFCLVIYSALSYFVAFKLPPQPHPTYPPHIVNLLAQKQRLFRSRSDPVNDELFQKVSKDLDIHVRKFMENRVKRLSTKSNFKGLFRFIKHRVKPSSGLPVLSDPYGSFFISDVEKAEALGNYFSSVFSHDDSNDGFEMNSQIRINHRLEHMFFHPQDVYKVLVHLKPSMAEPYDGIPQILYRKCASSLCQPLTHIFNLSMLLEEVPDIWKESIVTAIPKKSDSKFLSDFRPISITPTASKVMERLIRNRMLDWLLKFNVIPEEQHGFLSGASTASNMLDSVFDWTTALNSGEAVDVIFIDLSKAFDKVCHSKLLMKLDSLGICGQLYGWFKSYFSCRYMTVRVGRSFSKRHVCRSGVPQGSVLSPLLFLIYTIDLPAYIKASSFVKTQIYADDIKLYASYSTLNHNEVQLALKHSVERLTEWAALWSLPVNLNKCFVLHLGGGLPWRCSINGTEFACVPSVKDLGILLSSDLKFSAHIDRVVNKAFAALFLILRNVLCNDHRILVRLYKAYVLPHLEYCSQVWSPWLKKDICKLEKVQQTFTRILFLRSFPKTEYKSIPRYEERLKMFGLTSLRQRRVVSDLVFCFRIIRKEVKLRASKYWTFRPNSARSNGFILQSRRIRRFRYTQTFNSFFFRTTRWLEKLPREVLQSPNGESF